MEKLIIYPEDGFRLHDPERAVGGVRCSLITSSVRIDFVSHTLIAFCAESSALGRAIGGRLMEESQIYRGVIQDAFAPPSKQPYRDAPAQKAKEPSLAPPPTAPLLEDDALSWAAGPDDGDLAAEFATTGSLVIVDTGVMAVNQVTVEGKQWIEQSDRVLSFLGTDPVNERWIRSLNQNLESLSQLETSDEIVERTLDHVRAGLAVCIAVYGIAPR